MARQIARSWMLNSPPHHRTNAAIHANMQVKFIDVPKGVTTICIGMVYCSQVESSCTPPCTPLPYVIPFIPVVVSRLDGLCLSSFWCKPSAVQSLRWRLCTALGNGA